jgi:hypothetical protein
MAPKRKKRKLMKEEQKYGDGPSYSKREKTKPPKTLAKGRTTPLKQLVISKKISEPVKNLELSLKRPLIKRDLESQPSTSKTLKHSESNISERLKPYVKQVDLSTNVIPSPQGPPGSPVKTPPLKKSQGKGGPFKGKSGKGGPFKGKSVNAIILNKSKETISGESGDGLYDPFAALRGEINDVKAFRPQSPQLRDNDVNKPADIDVKKEDPSVSANRRDPQPLSDPSEPSTSKPFENIQIPPDDIERMYKLYEFDRRTVKKYGVSQINYRVRFNKELEGQTLHSLQASLYQMFDDLLDELSNEHHAQDKVHIFIHSSDLKYNTPILIPLRFLHEFDVDSIMHVISNVLNQTLALDHKLRVEVGILKMHRGGGSLKLVRHGLDDPFNENFYKKAVINIPMVDKMCAARAVSVAYSRLMKHKNYSNIRNGKKNMQKYIAYGLLQDVGLPTNRDIEIGEFYQFEEHLNIQVIIYNKPISEGIIYSGHWQNESKIFLYYSQDGNSGHFDVISTMAAFLSKSFYCKHCLLGYNKRSGHECFMTCKTCHSDECSIETPLTCRHCQLECRSHACYLRHLGPRQHGGNNTDMDSICNTFWKCHKCSLIEKSPNKKDHVCGEGSPCRQCGKKLEIGKHLCYMRASKPKKASGKFIYFDFEATVEQEYTCEGGYKMEPDEGCLQCTPTDKCPACRLCVRCKNDRCALMQHVANYVVAQSVCDTCIDITLEPDSKCDDCGSRCLQCSLFDKKKKMYRQPPCPGKCGHREVVFKGANTSEGFASWLCSLSTETSQ